MYSSLLLKVTYMYNYYKKKKKKKRKRKEEPLSWVHNHVWRYGRSIEPLFFLPLASLRKDFYHFEGGYRGYLLKVKLKKRKLIEIVTC